MSLFSLVSKKDHQESDETSLTIEDILEIQNEWSEESAAVLGGSDEKCCTYSSGYIKRQALYSCLTCCPESRTDIAKCAGICLACSYQCHENHEMIELYTKRNFRCDCPTKKISGTKCSFTENKGNSSSETNSIEKLEVNSKNSYDHNFTGVYCTCKRPYPDPEKSISDEMVQCTICEDWYHTSHLNGDLPEDGYTEVICETCVKNNPFLKDYAGIAIKKIEKSSENVDISVDSTVENEEINKNEASSSKAINSKEGTSVSDEEKDKTDKAKNERVDSVLKDNDEKTHSNSDENSKLLNKETDTMPEENEPECKKIKLDTEATTSNVSIKSDKVALDAGESVKPQIEATTSVVCTKPNGNNLYSKGPLFWCKGWRDALCRCSSCKKMYENYKCSYLLDEEDTVQFYEERGIRKFQESESEYEKCVQAFSGLDHVQKIRFATGYNQMVDKLKEYLRPFKESQKVITERDIREIFEKLKSEKASLDEVNVPHFCR